MHRAPPRLPMLVATALAVGCARGGPDDTGWTNGGATGAGACQPQPGNALRFDCALPGEVDVEVAGPDGAFTVTGGPALTLYGLTAQTAYTWTARDAGEVVASGTFTTGALPAWFDDLTFAVSGTRGPDAIALPARCGEVGMALIVDGEGRPIWYEPLDISPDPDAPGISGFELTPQGTLLFTLDNVRLIELDLTGAVVASHLGYPHPLHHDITRGPDYTYALFATTYDLGDRTVIVDGFYALDAAGQVVATWELLDHLSVVPGGSTGGFWGATFPGAEDVTHTNSIAATDDGDVILSHKALSTMTRVAANPDAADFGEVRWAVDARGLGVLGPTWSVASGGFSGQHHAHLGDDGALWMLDNAGSDVSAGEIYDLDPAAQTASLRASYPAGAFCPRQGSMFALPDGGVLTGCADQGIVSAYDAGAPVPRWTMDVVCADGGDPEDPGKPMVFSRSAPIELR